MKVLVIGSGAREHAIAHALMRGAASAKSQWLRAIQAWSLTHPHHADQPSNHAALIDFVKNNGYDWVFVGPEVPLIEASSTISRELASRRLVRARPPRKSRVPRISPSS